MAQGSRVCPHCGGLNGIAEQVCYRCGKKMPGPVARSVQGLSSEILGQEFLATKVFWGICVIVFAACLAVDGRASSLLGGFRSSTEFRFGMLWGPILPSEPFRLLSAVFVHANIIHVVFNSMALLDLGRLIEGHFGAARLSVLFVATGIAGFIASVFWQPMAPTLGASGGIFGLMGAMVGIYLVRRDPVLKAMVKRVLMYALLLTVATIGTGVVNTAAHLGGFVAGVGLGYLFDLERRRHRRVVEVLMGVLGVACVVASIGSIVLANRSPFWKEVRAEETLRE